MIIGTTTYHRVARDGIAHPLKGMDSDAPFSHRNLGDREVAIFLATNSGASENGFAFGRKVPKGIRRTLEATALGDLNALVGRDIVPTGR